MSWQNMGGLKNRISFIEVLEGGLKRLRYQHDWVLAMILFLNGQHLSICLLRVRRMIWNEWNRSDSFFFPSLYEVKDSTGLGPRIVGSLHSLLPKVSCSKYSHIGGLGLKWTTRYKLQDRRNDKTKVCQKAVWQGKEVQRILRVWDQYPVR